VYNIPVAGVRAEEIVEVMGASQFCPTVRATEEHQMYRNMKLWLVASGIAAGLIASPANAQHGGGGHGGGGGGHGGSMGGGAHAASSGSWHGGSGSGNWHGGSNGNWHGGNGYYHNGNYYHGGYYHGGYPYYGYGYGYPIAFGVGLGLGLYSSAYYGGYGYSGAPYVAAYEPAYGQTIALDSAQTIAAPQQNASTSAYPLAQDKVRMLVVVPNPDVRLTINGTPTSQKGTDRLFDSPSMEPGKAYVYKLTATWSKDGHEITRTKEIDVETGKVYTVVFQFDPEVAPPPVARPIAQPPAAQPG
jgi:uncharacterized protein (TIGR03000 family)